MPRNVDVMGCVMRWRRRCSRNLSRMVTEAVDRRYLAGRIEAEGWSRLHCIIIHFIERGPAMSRQCCTKSGPKRCCASLSGAADSTS